MSGQGGGKFEGEGYGAHCTKATVQAKKSPCNEGLSFSIWLHDLDSNQGPND